MVTYHSSRIGPICLCILAALVACGAPDGITEAESNPGRELSLDADTLITWSWDSIMAATGDPSEFECSLTEIPSPECCQLYPHLPGCSPSCGDERDDIIAEYGFYSVYVTPSCNDFANSGGSANFSWSELNGGFTNGNPHSPWGIVKTGLIAGLEETRTNYNRGGIRLTSGYRCPHGNSDVDGASQSYHTHGSSADMKSASHVWTEQEFNLLKAAAASTDPAPIESFFWNTYPEPGDRHFHASW